MREAFTEGRAAVAGHRRSRRTTPPVRPRVISAVSVATCNLARSYCQVELRQSVKFMERFSSTLLRDYLSQIRAAIVDGQETGAFRTDLNATSVAKMFFGALRRDGHELDSEPPTLFPPKPTPICVVDLLPQGRTGTMRIHTSIRSAAVASARGPWARRLPRTLRTPACAALPLRSDGGDRERGLKRASALRPEPVLHGRRRGAHHSRRPRS